MERNARVKFGPMIRTPALRLAASTWAPGSAWMTLLLCPGLPTYTLSYHSARIRAASLPAPCGYNLQINKAKKFEAESRVSASWA